MEHRIALAQASSVAGEAILARLDECGIAADALVLLDHESNLGKRLPYGNGHIKVQDQLGADLSDYAVLLMPEADAELEAAALQQGCLLLSHAIEHDSAPIFLTQMSADLDIDYGVTSLRLAAAELCCLLPVLMALETLQGISQLGITLVRSAEFRGRDGVSELAAQTIDLLNARDAKSEVFPLQIAFNFFPEAPAASMAADLQVFLKNSRCTSTLQTLTVPVFHGFAAAIQLRFSAEVELENCRELLDSIPNLDLKTVPISPVSDCNQSFNCALSHLEQPPQQPSNLQFWIVADPMRYGLANNYVNVLESLLKSFL